MFFINDADFRYNLIKYDTSTKSWSKIASGSSLAQYTDMTEYGGKLYLAYTVGNYPYEVRVAILDTKTNEITELAVYAQTAATFQYQQTKTEYTPLIAILMTAVSQSLPYGTVQLGIM